MARHCTPNRPRLGSAGLHARWQILVGVVEPDPRRCKAGRQDHSENRGAHSDQKQRRALAPGEGRGQPDATHRLERGRSHARVGSAERACIRRIYRLWQPDPRRDESAGDPRNHHAHLIRPSLVARVPIRNGQGAKGPIRVTPGSVSVSGRQRSEPPVELAFSAQRIPAHEITNSPPAVPHGRSAGIAQLIAFGFTRSGAPPWGQPDLPGSRAGGLRTERATEAAARPRLASRDPAHSPHAPGWTGPPTTQARQ